MRERIRLQKRLRKRGRISQTWDGERWLSTLLCWTTAPYLNRLLCDARLSTTPSLASLGWSRTSRGSRDSLACFFHTENLLWHSPVFFYARSLVLNVLRTKRRGQIWYHNCYGEVYSVDITLVVWSVYTHKDKINFDIFALTAAKSNLEDFYQDALIIWIGMLIIEMISFSAAFCIENLSGLLLAAPLFWHHRTETCEESIQNMQESQKCHSTFWERNA